MTEPLDEEALNAHLSAAERKRLGSFFTPRELVDDVLETVAPFVPRQGPLRIIDPACGAGAFLSSAATRWPHAQLVGVELDETSASMCRQRVPRATVLTGDMLMAELLPPRDDAFELWVGNPPWNGTSALLQSPEAWARACSWLPSNLPLRRGTSLREDYVFFLLKASLRLKQGPGALAFITSATLLDAYAHAPVREALLSRLKLRAVRVLPRGTFAGTRVEPCVTWWTTAGVSMAASAPDWNLRPIADGAKALDAEWSIDGLPLDRLVPVSFAGLKTRFDELLVDDHREVLEARVRGFLQAKQLDQFAEAFGLSALMPKLTALREFAGDATFDAKNVRRFLRYRGPKPMRTAGWCYLDRALIPRGDHRIRGGFDPHLEPLKLVFNMHELPLAAHVLDEPGCVTMYRHSRFAPAFVPRAQLADPRVSDFDPNDLVPNLTPEGAALGSVREVFTHIASHIMSRPFQEVWAPAFGTTRAPLVRHP